MSVFTQKVAKAKGVDTALEMDAIDIIMVSQMRLVLAISILLTAIVESSKDNITSTFAWFVFTGYVGISIVLYGLSHLKPAPSESWVIHWLDIFWYALIVLATGGINSIFFLLFFFAILVSSFRFGFEEGAQITIASAVMFVASGILSGAVIDFPKLLMRTTFLLTLGYMSAHWGESKVSSKRRLALLREVNRLSNPRFGVDQTISSVLEKTRSFFGGEECLLILHDKGSNEYSLRNTKENWPAGPHAQFISQHVADSLLSFPHDQTVLYASPLWPIFKTGGCTLAYDSKHQKWKTHSNHTDSRLADLIEAPFYISSPVSLRKGHGRIYVTSTKNKFSKADALFLSHIVEQSFTVIDNIDLLDRIASEAASEERKKITWDLHDTTIQPYIGLKLGLCAARMKATENNPLAEELDKLIATTNQVIADLRSFANSIKSPSHKTSSILFSALRTRLAQLKKFYDMDIAVTMEPSFQIRDRLAVEIFYLVNEGLNNICKHTSAQRGKICIGCEQEWLKLLIKNEGDGTQCQLFTPRSICERATALGGDVRVKISADGGAEVHINIPL